MPHLHGELPSPHPFNLPAFQDMHLSLLCMLNTQHLNVELNIILHQLLGKPAAYVFDLLTNLFMEGWRDSFCASLRADSVAQWLMCYSACRSALMNACCSYQPADRPSFSDAAEHLERIVASFSAAEAESQRVTV